MSGSGSRSSSSPPPPPPTSSTSSGAVNSVAVGTTKLYIPKLRGQANYITWRASTRLYLGCTGSLGYIDGTRTAPTDVQSPDYETWLSKDSAARLSLLLSITEEWQHLVSEASNSHDAWTALENQFDRRNMVSLHHLFKTVINCKMESSQTLQQYLNHFDQTWVRLKNRTHNAPSTDTFAAIVRTLMDSDISKAHF